MSVVGIVGIDNIIGARVNVDFECIYKKVELKHLAELPRSENGTIDAEEEEDIMYLCEEVYREEFLKFFNVTFFEEDVINARVKKLFASLNEHEKFSKILKTLSIKCNIFKEDPEQAFMQLFSYHFFHTTFDCIKQLVSPDESCKLSFELLENAVELFGTE
jgi:hypothetical protein